MELSKARNGSFTAKLNNCQIHSAYNPEREAASFLNRSTACNQKCILIIGSGLGYIEKELLKKDTNKIISLSLTPEAFQFKKKNLPDDRRLVLLNRDFSRHETGLSQWDALSLKILEWEPVCKICSKEYSHVLTQLKMILRNLNSNLNTTRFFGRKWIRNSIINFYRINSYTTLNYHESDIVICAAGSTLDDLLPLLKQKRKSFVLIAVSSALAALKQAGIIPDLCILSDPGHYTLQHFQDGCGDLPQNFALPLTAASWEGFEHKSVLPLFQNSPVENILELNALMPSLTIRESGTVSSASVMAALQLTRGRVFLAGQDFAFSDVKQHCEPHVFMERRRALSHRKAPLIQGEWLDLSRYSPLEKIGKWQAPSSFSQYRDWFSEFENKERLYHLSPTAFTIRDMKALDREEWQSLDSPEKKKTVSRSTSAGLEKKRAVIHTKLDLLTELFHKNMPESLDSDLRELAFILAPRLFLTYTDKESDSKELRSEICHKLAALKKL